MKLFLERYKTALIWVFALFSPLALLTGLYKVSYLQLGLYVLGTQPPAEVRWMWFLVSCLPGLASFWRLPVNSKFRLFLISTVYLAVMLLPLGALALRLGCPSGICG